MLFRAASSSSNRFISSSMFMLSPSFHCDCVLVWVLLYMCVYIYTTLQGLKQLRGRGALSCGCGSVALRCVVFCYVVLCTAAGCCVVSRILRIITASASLGAYSVHFTDIKNATTKEKRILFIYAFFSLFAYIV